MVNANEAQLQTAAAREREIQAARALILEAVGSREYEARLSAALARNIPLGDAILQIFDDLTA